MALSSIFRHVATSGNLAPVAKDTPIYTKAGKKHIHYNIVPGQLVAYLTNRDGTIPLAIEAADITAANVHRLRVGVGHRAPGSNQVVIRYIGVDEAGSCSLEHASISSPRCGSPMVEDFFFDCITCYDNYTLVVGVDDNFTRSHSPLQKSTLEFIGAHTPNCATCDGCDTPVTCDEIVEGIVDSIRGDKAPMIQGKPYPDYRHNDVELPFEITKIQSRSLVYCLAFTEPATECEECDMVSAIGAVTIGGVAYPLLGTTVPGDATQTARIQLASVVDQINGLIEEHLGRNKGSAYLTGVTPSQCCPLQLHVNIDDATFALTDGAEVPVALVPSEDVDPFAVGQIGEGYTCGIRVIAAPITGDCECFLTKEAATYARRVTISGHDGFVDGISKTKQEMTMPGQFGLQIQHRELHQTRGGSGRTYGAGYSQATWSGAPRQDSLIVQAPMSKCEEDYCSFYARSKWYFKNYGNSQDEHRRLDSFIHVPSGDAVTLAAVQALVAKWAEVSSTCDADIASLVCTPLETTCA